MVSISDLVMINKEILGDSSGMKDNTKQLLGSSLSSFVYQDTENLKVSSIVRGILKNHPFVDGNKRTGLLVLLILSDKLGLKVTDDLFNSIMSISQNEYSVDKISKMLLK